MMNGDPRKTEIAAAQAYFAVRTREAEVQRSTHHELPATFAEALRLAADQAEQIEAAKAQIEAVKPLVAQAQTFRQAEGLHSIGDLANQLQAWAKANLPGIKPLHKEVWEIAGQVGLIIRGNTVRHNQPTARAIEAGWVRSKDGSYEDSKGATHTTITPRLTPRGYGRLWDACVAHYTTTTKEIAA